MVYNNALHLGIFAPMESVIWKIKVRDFWEETEALHRCTELQQLTVESALARGDTAQARAYLEDWEHIAKRYTRVSKYEPGDHYYVLDTKFESLEEAIEHARELGWHTLPLTIIKVNAVLSGYRTGD